MFVKSNKMSQQYSYIKFILLDKIIKLMHNVIINTTLIIIIFIIFKINNNKNCLTWLA